MEIMVVVFIVIVLSRQLTPKLEEVGWKRLKA